ncbi:hypothetical protein N8312_01125 [bacterium]|nr:hypothetical protein [bacterium]
MQNNERSHWFDFQPENFKFELTEGRLAHNGGVEYALFAVWKDARPNLSKIRDYLQSNFDIILETQVIWSDKYFYNNACRLYDVPFSGKESSRRTQKGHRQKIGEPAFPVFIVKDKKPDYGYFQSVSGSVAPGNQNVVRAKKYFRSLSPSSFSVHSSNDISEFYTQAILIFGVDVLREILDGKRGDMSVISKDLEGADGWLNWEHLYRVMNCTANYLVLRNFEEDPLLRPNSDLDLLAEDYQRLGSVMALKQHFEKGKPYKGILQIAGEEKNIDISFVGDGYIDQTWQLSMLNAKEKEGLLFRPDPQNYFFSLLYHAAVHKHEISERYRIRLLQLAEDIRFDGFTHQTFNSPENITSIISGFMNSNGYIHENAIDEAIIQNQNVIKSLNTHRIPSRQGRLLRIKNKLERIFYGYG